MQVRRILGAVSWCLAGSTAWSTQGSWTARKCQPCPRTPVSYVPGLNTKRQRNEAKKTLSKRRLISAHSVQFQYLGTRKERCSPEPPMCETLLLANPDMNTLRHQCSRASTN